MPDEALLRKPFLALVVVGYALLSCAALGWLRLAGRTLRVGPGPTPALAGLALGLAVVALSHVALLQATWAKRLAEEFVRLLPDLGWVDVLVVALASGVAEELFFRGALQPAVGLWPAALIFGLLHSGPSRRFLPWTLFALVMGVALGLLYERTGDIAAPIMAHVTINTLNLRALGRFKAATPSLGESQDPEAHG